MKVLYTAGARRWRVWFVFGLSVVGAVAGVWAGVNLGQTYGMSPAEGGVLKPLPVRLAWAISLSGLGLAFLGGMVVYARRYVTRLQHDAVAGVVHVETLIGARVIPVDHLTAARYHAGRLELEHHVNAPWTSLRVRGRRIPYILDLQGDVHDARALAGLTRERAPVHRP